jgi:hypothetical protein
MGFSFGKYFFAAASLITTIFGAVSLSRGVKPRPSMIGISIISKKLVDVTRRLMPLFRSRCPVG